MRDVTLTKCDGNVLVLLLLNRGILSMWIYGYLRPAGTQVASSGVKQERGPRPMKSRTA